MLTDLEIEQVNQFIDRINACQGHVFQNEIFEQPKTDDWDLWISRCLNCNIILGISLISKENVSKMRAAGIMTRD